MGTVNVTLGDGKKLNLILGQQLENAVTAVVFDFSAWQTEFGSGTLGLSVQRHGDTQPYAVVPTVSGTNATWNITELDTAYKGVGEVQVTYTVGSVVKKSTVYKFTVYRSLGENGEYPSPGQTWQEEIEDELADVKQDLTSYIGNYHAELVSGWREITTPQTITESASWVNSLVPCIPGQKFHVKGSGGNDSRLWMFFDSQNQVLTDSGTGTRKADYVTITAPPNASYLVFNSRITEQPTYVPDCIVNSFLRDDVDALTDTVFSDVVLTWELGTANTGNGSLSDSTTTIRSNLFKCNSGSSFIADADYRIVPMRYNAETGTYIDIPVGWVTSYTTDDTYLIRLLAKKYDTSTISDVSAVSSRINLDLKTDSNVTNLSNEIDKINNKPLRKYTQEYLDVSKFTASAGSTDWYWANNAPYPSGYIDHFVVYGTDSSIGSTAHVAVYDKTLGQFVWLSDGVVCDSTKKVEIPCKAYFENEIYVLVSLPHIAHGSVGNTVKYANMWEFAVWSEGAVFDVEWKTTDVTFKFAVECWYDDYVDMHSLHYAKLKNRMFVAGDSITAGYPYTSGISRPNYYDPDIRWGSQVSRKLGFEVTFGAQTGSGWLYRTSSTAQYAISIADNNNFANYDTAVFAFGTNDYGNNMPLGNITDVYPTNETVCGAMNYVINKIYTDNPKIVLIISSPINRSDKGSSSSNYGYGTANTQGYTLLQLLEKMKELCIANGVCFIDNSNCPFNKYTLSSLLTDNLHPNPDGYKILGSFLAERISQFVTPYTRNVLTAEF